MRRRAAWCWAWSLYSRWCSGKRLQDAPGQWEQARAELVTAIEMSQSMAMMMFWLPQTETALAQLNA